MKRYKHKISYIKRPFARKSLVSALFAVLALVFGAISLGLSIRVEGNGGMEVGAWGFSSFLFSTVSLAYGILSFLEKEMNYVLSKISVGISAVLVVSWVCIIIVGLLI